MTTDDAPVKNVKVNGTSVVNNNIANINYDSSLSSTSTNAVQNKVINDELEDKVNRMGDEMYNELNITETDCSIYNTVRLTHTGFVWQFIKKDTGEVLSTKNLFWSELAKEDQLTDGSVTKVGTDTVGSTTNPIYLNNGTPTACGTTTHTLTFEKSDGTTTTLNVLGTVS